MQEQNSSIPRFNSTLASLECRGLQDSTNNRKLIKSPEHGINWICQKDSEGGRTEVLKEIWAGGRLGAYFPCELVGWRCSLGPLTSKMLTSLFCYIHQTGEFLPKSQREVLWPSWDQRTAGCQWKDYTLLPTPPSPSFCFPWMITFSWPCLWHYPTQLNHLRATSVFFLPRPWSPKEIIFRWLRSLRQLGMGPSNSHLITWLVSSPGYRATIFRILPCPFLRCIGSCKP